ncbi:hypothetical protein TNCV_454791 [Trichonephila clavipes]|nr:hypothetical protein TNCV_454791 [Trichonephila clavipes]
MVWRNALGSAIRGWWAYCGHLKVFDREKLVLTSIAIVYRHLNSFARTKVSNVGEFDKEGMRASRCRYMNRPGSEVNRRKENPKFSLK